MLMRKILCELTLASLLHAAVAKVCSPAAADDATTDDALAINNAIKECGRNGTIIISSPNDYTLRTPIDVSPCKNCDIQIESVVQVALGQWNFWRGIGHVISVANTTGVHIRSVTGKGVLDGNAQEWFFRSEWVPPQYNGVALIKVTNQSSDVTIENLVMKNSMSRFVQLSGNSTKITLRDLSMSCHNVTLREAETTPFGIETGLINDVDINNISMEFSTQTDVLYPNGTSTGTCAAFDLGTYNLRMRNVNCKNAWGGALVEYGSINVPSPTSAMGDILVSNFTFEGVKATGFQSLWEGPRRYARNITWDGVTIKSGTPAEINICYLRLHNSTPYPNECPPRVSTEILDVWFKNFRGHVGAMPTDPGWGNWNEISHVEAHFENWVDVGNGTIT